MTEREALKLALEALHGFIPYLPLNDEAQCGRYDEALIAIKEALAQPEPWEKFCDSSCVWTDHHPDCKLAQPEYQSTADKSKLEKVPAKGTLLAQPEQEPVACDGDFPEGFDASLGVPAQALRVANAIMCDVIGKREWDVPCTAQHVLSFAKKYTTTPQRKPLTDEEIILIVAECAASHQHTDIHFARAIERAHGIKELV